MKRVCAALALVLVVAAGCGSSDGGTPQTGFSPVEAQNVLTQLTVNAGYEVAGIPTYEATHWASNVRIDGCTANITVAAPDAPASAVPRSFSVVTVAGESFASLSPGTNAMNLKADALKSLPGMTEKLACSK